MFFCTLRVSSGDSHFFYDFHKNTLENVPITSLTISFVESHYPRVLDTHLRKIRNYKVEEKSPGIYTVSGDILPIQIIDSSKLSVEENLWLKGLNRFKVPEAWRIVTKVSLQGDPAKIGAYLDAIVRANIDVLQEAYKMSDVCYTGIPALDELLEEVGYMDGYTARMEAKIEAKMEAAMEAKIEAKMEARGEERVLDIARNLVNLGLPLETVVSATGLGIDKVKEMYVTKEQ